MDDRRNKAVGNQVKARAAVRRALERHKVDITAKRYSGGRMSARILVEGEYYDVDERQLALVEAGKHPQRDLALEPVLGDMES